MQIQIVADIGCNHCGSMDTVRNMVAVLTGYVGANVVKFQKRATKELPKETRDRPYDNPNSFGKTYGEHRDALELSINQHRYLKDIIEQTGATYSCSVWDIVSAKQIAGLSPKYIKIPSACNLNFQMIQWLVDHYGGQIHIALGMTTAEEKDLIVDFVRRTGQTNRFVAYLCTSAYPCPFDRMYLKDIQLLKAWRTDPGLKAYGFSGHHKGIAIDIAAAALGCKYIERHFTLDRTWKGTDHSASLEPDGMKKLVRDIRAFEQAFQQGTGEVYDCEKPHREKLKNA